MVGIEERVELYHQIDSPGIIGTLSNFEKWAEIFRTVSM